MGFRSREYFGRKKSPRAGRADGTADGVALVRTKIVHDVAGPQRRDKNLFDIEAEAFAVDRPVDEPWSCDAIVTRGQEGHGLPVAMRHLTYYYQLGYFPMTSPVNVAIYAFGGFLLFALAVGFFATPV